MAEVVDQTAKGMKMLEEAGFWSFVLGIAGIAGTMFGIYATLKHRNRKTASFWYKSSVLLAESKNILPEEVTIQFDGKPISHLKKMNVVFWNTGNVTIDGSDIVRHDPLRFALEGKFDLFKVSIAAETKEANGVKPGQHTGQKNEFAIDFTYLDPGQGLNLEMLYQGELVRPIVHGTIKGIPHDFTDVVKSARSFFYKAVRGFYTYSSASAFVFAIAASVPASLLGIWSLWEEETYEPALLFSFVVVLVILHSFALYVSRFFIRQKLSPPNDLLV